MRCCRVENGSVHSSLRSAACRAPAHRNSLVTPAGYMSALLKPPQDPPLSSCATHFCADHPSVPSACYVLCVSSSAVRRAVCGQPRDLLRFLYDLPAVHASRSLIVRDILLLSIRCPSFETHRFQDTDRGPNSSVIDRYVVPQHGTVLNRA